MLAKQLDADHSKEYMSPLHTNFSTKLRLKGCNNCKPLSVLKPQNRTKNDAKLHHRKPLCAPLLRKLKDELISLSNVK